MSETSGPSWQRFVYEDSGEGPLVVLLHGFPDTPAGWADTRASLNAAGSLGKCCAHTVEVLR
jgi:pimeloyl-ACP methyl ester carboxylesterase